MIATIINALAVLIGTTIGLLLKKYIRPSFKVVVMLSAGLVTLILGLQMALETPQVLVMLFALILGGGLGYALRIEERVLALGTLVSGKGSGDGNAFAYGFLNASLLFCTGAMSIVGAIEAGTTHDYDLILIKSVMDGFMAVVFAATYGPGVYLSSLTVLIYQGFFTYAGAWISPLLGDVGIQALSATGGILLIMLALNLLEIRQCKVGAFLPSLLLVPLLQYGYQFLPL